MSSLYTEISKEAAKQQQKLAEMYPQKQQAAVSTRGPLKPAGNPGTQESRKPGSQPTNQTTAQSDASPPPDHFIPFDPDPLDDQAIREKSTYDLTENNIDFLNQTQFELRKWKINKYEIVQTALELLAKDYAYNQGRSYLLRKFQHKKPGDRNY